MNNDGKLTLRQEKFIQCVLQGDSLKNAYLKSFPESFKNVNSIYVKASLLFNQPAIHKRYEELRAIIEEELKRKSIWTKEQSINELKELLRKNRAESDRYEQAYNDEMEILDKQIAEKENELNNPKGYVSKKLKASLQDDIDTLKMARIQCNRRHQSNKNVNDAILQSIQQLNEMMGFNKKEEQKVEVQAQVSFVDDIPEDDEKDLYDI